MSLTTVHPQPMGFELMTTCLGLPLDQNAAAAPNTNAVGENALNGAAMKSHLQSLSSVVRDELSLEFKSLLGLFCSSVVLRLQLSGWSNDLQVGGSNSSSSLCPWARR